MVKKAKLMLVMVLMVSMLANVSSASAKYWEKDTEGGKLGSTTVTCTIDISGGSSTYNQACLGISAGNRVEKLGIKNINVIKKDGGGVTGAKVSKTDAFSASYAGPAYGPGSIDSISAHFYVTSANFGNFSINHSY